ncbi:tetratricopeptide repeat protein [Herbaspirillum sp. RTI4]|uniref:tetratricopeptide repeat protein n=1 Tax=Herbaspirillum sp. RTI4 TaxID=3048640 RepID=UPI002AB51516|nr:tetratricopeptide repeat protein [Herbaspirillum sp. RTI4]MDY7576926.1 tetratricopeptide repeat protein [Herbaspirillum sp. RTI4]MEA9983203.1 tetratricopeptide repeat protein [Herbaspirillum sp. RTI4]
MANREDLAIIRAARNGQATAQVTLGLRYLAGGQGLPQSLTTALHWLDRAARQDVPQAWMEIATHIPYEVALQSADFAHTCLWYERAFEAGDKQAGLVFAKLVLLREPLACTPEIRAKALRALEGAANDGVADAQWLLAQQNFGDAAAESNMTSPDSPVAERTGVEQKAALAWAERAADSGVAQARLSLADAAWEQGDRAGFLRRALPLVTDLQVRFGAVAEQFSAPSDALERDLGSDNVRLLRRSAEVLLADEHTNIEQVQHWLELAAYANDRQAQFALGLLFARMSADGNRATKGIGSANYKKAIRWLLLAGERGVAGAWYALSRIYLKPEFSQRNLADAQNYLERAGEMGHLAAQLECGVSAWRNRRDAADNDVRAVYWLQKAIALDPQRMNGEAAQLLSKIAVPASPAPWALHARRHWTRELSNAHPFLSARIELAELFGLTRAEALWIDLKKADCGHCLRVDIRADYARSKRRLILIDTGDERQALNRIGRLFEDVDCGTEGPEGNYRQRLYRLKIALPQLDVADSAEIDGSADLADERV